MLKIYWKFKIIFELSMYEENWFFVNKCAKNASGSPFSICEFITL